MTKRNLSAAVAVVAVIALVLSLALIAGAEDAKKEGKAEAAKMEKATYIVISPHTAEECLAVLDNVKDMGPDALAKYDWGCVSGDHNGYARVQASSEEEALSVVPENIRSKARAIKVAKLTAAQIEAYHEKH